MKLTEKGATVPFHQIRRHHIVNDIKRLASNAANKRLKAWRCLCKHAHGIHMDDDPSEGIKTIPCKKTEGHTPWTNEDIARYRDHWNIDTPERLALELIYWTGARMSDAGRLGRGMVDADRWPNFTQMKTGGNVSVPFDRAIPEFCDPTDNAFLHQAVSSQTKHMTFIVTACDASRSHKGAAQ
jgi:integrase